MTDVRRPPGFLIVRAYEDETGLGLVPEHILSPLAIESTRERAGHRFGEHNKVIMTLRDGRTLYLFADNLQDVSEKLAVAYAERKQLVGDGGSK